MKLRYVCPYCERRHISELPLVEKPFDMACECGATLTVSGGNTYVYQHWYAPPKTPHLKLVE